MKTKIYVNDLSTLQRREIKKDLFNRFLDDYAAENGKTTNNGEADDWVGPEIEDEINEKVDDFLGNHEGWELEI